MDTANLDNRWIALRSFLAGDLLNQEESEGFLAQLEADAAAADAGNKSYTIEETR
jgi:hypothetical protein